MTTKGPPESCLLLKNIKLLVTLNEDLGNITDAAVFVKGNVIDWVGKSAHIPAHYITPDLDALDLSNRIVLPGLVNTHHHMFQHLTRAVAPVRRPDMLAGWAHHGMLSSMLVPLACCRYCCSTSKMAYTSATVARWHKRRMCGVTLYSHSMLVCLHSYVPCVQDSELFAWLKSLYGAWNAMTVSHPAA